MPPPGPPRPGVPPMYPCCAADAGAYVGGTVWQLYHGLQPAPLPGLGVRVAEAIEHHHPHQDGDIDLVAGAAKDAAQLAEAQCLPRFLERPDRAQFAGPSSLNLGLGVGFHGWCAFCGLEQPLITASSESLSSLNRWLSSCSRRSSFLHSTRLTLSARARVRAGSAYATCSSDRRSPRLRHFSHMASGNRGPLSEPHARLTVGFPRRYHGPLQLVAAEEVFSSWALVADAVEKCL